MMSHAESNAQAGPAFLGSEFDVVVVGAGAAGLSAAIFAAQAGAKTLVLERSEFIGGTSALSGGWMWLPGASRAKIAKQDTREDATAYIKSLAGDNYRSELVDAYFDNVPSTVESLESLGLKLVHAEGAPDYEEDKPGAVKGGRAISADSWYSNPLGARRKHIRRPMTSMRVFGVVPQLGEELNNFVQSNQSIKSFIYVAMKIAAATLQTMVYGRPTRLTNGNALVGQLYHLAIESGVHFALSSKVTALSRSSDRIDGVTAETPWGRKQLTAKGGVILACGGISWNQELIAEHFPHAKHGVKHSSAVTEEHDGQAVALSKPFGARFAGEIGQAAAWAPVTVFGARERRLFPHLRSIGLPGLIAVNSEGERFTNEADSYHAFGDSLISDASEKNEVRAFLISDAKTMRKYGIGYAKPFPIPRFAYFRNGYLMKGNTLDEIARKCGFDAATLKQTVADYNADAEQGVDSKFGRGNTYYNRFRGDKNHKPNPSVGPIGAGPFYASPITIGDLGAFVGLDVDGGANVLDEAGAQVPGLFAAGTAAVSPFGGGYPGYGGMLGPAVIMGAVAGKKAAEDAKGA